MPAFTAILLGFGIGLIYGFVMEKSRIFEPGIVIGQMQLRNFTLVKVWFTAIITALACMTLLTDIGLVRVLPKPTLFVADIIGGLLVGAGMTLAGGSPAMVLVQIGAGYRDAWWSVAGCLAGVAAFCALSPLLAPLLTAGPAQFTIVNFSILPFAAWAVAIGVALIAAILALERVQPWRSDLGPNVDGIEPERARSAAESPPPDLFDPDFNPTHELIGPPEAKST